MLLNSFKPLYSKGKQAC